VELKRQVGGVPGCLIGRREDSRRNRGTYPCMSCLLSFNSGGRTTFTKGDAREEDASLSRDLRSIQICEREPGRATKERKGRSSGKGGPGHLAKSLWIFSCLKNQRARGCLLEERSGETCGSRVSRDSTLSRKRSK